MDMIKKAAVFIVLASCILFYIPAAVYADTVTEEGKTEETDKKPSGVSTSDKNEEADKKPSGGSTSGKWEDFINKKPGSMFDKWDTIKRKDVPMDDQVRLLLVKPFLKIIDWSRTQKIVIGKVSFTFFDFWLWQILAGVFIWFARFVLYRS